MRIFEKLLAKVRETLLLAKLVICQQFFSELVLLKVMFTHSLSSCTQKTLCVTAVKFNANIMKGLQTKAVVHRHPGVFFFLTLGFCLILITHISHREVSQPAP